MSGNEDGHRYDRQLSMNLQHPYSCYGRGGKAGAGYSGYRVGRANDGAREACEVYEVLDGVQEVEDEWGVEVDGLVDHA